ncbi:DUF3592 domain-containing protein [Kribbella sp. NPDC048928]|uniref:DUF3592 domain-containing protein n=1 Tax=Kribbella sp. NPDC048928 TaxID=3364111 RepID=UPI00371F8341
MKQTKAGRAYGLAAFCFAAAAVFGVLGGLELWHIHSLRLRGEVVLGHVVASDIPECVGGRGGCSHPRRDWIEVEYVTLAGQKLRHKTTGGIRDSATVGSWIEVRYDRENPQLVQDAYSPLGYTVPLAVSGGFTALFLVFAALLMRKRRRDD